MEIIFNNTLIPQNFEAWQTAFNGDSVKRKRQWGQDKNPDRSARCLAHYICDMQGMKTIKDTIEEITSSISVNTIYPESLVKFDNFGGKRNHDLAFFSENKRVFVSIEAKVAEKFGKPISVWLKEKDSEDRIKRRDSLMDFFKVKDDSLYNQLLFGLKSTITGVLSTGKQILRQIDSADYHIMLVLVFNTPETDQNKIAKNKADFDKFVGAIKAIRLDNIKKSECYKVPVGKNSFIAYKKVDYLEK